MRSVNVSRLSLAVLACVLLIVPRAHAQGFTLQIDENGNGLLNGGFHPGFQLLDPGPGGLPNALTYTTPGGLVVGDLLLHEPGSGESDLVRWNANGTLVFYSDSSNIDTNPFTHLPQFDLADIGLPGQAYPNGFSVTEIGLFGAAYIEDPTTTSNGYVYVPLVGQPGYDTTNPNNQPTYIIISDIPEPSTLALLILGMGGLITACRRNRKG
jgi:hypothetical protein